jgi:phytoene dehydrogenase-like protein
MESSNNKTMLIIGAGIAGLSMGIYAQLNGYDSKIHEMHTQPGGLMTSWKRKGYTIDGCIHWLTGSSKEYDYYRYWEEIGLIQEREIFNPEIFTRVEGRNGEILNLYCDANRLEQHLSELAPEDKKVIHEMCSAIRSFTKWNPGIDNNLSDTMKSFIPMAAVMPTLIKWGKLSMKEFASRLKNTFLRETFSTLWFPDISMVGLLVTLSMLHRKAAGYPLGGSLPMAEAVEKRYLELGGQINYNARVDKILVENGKAVGIRLEDGTEQRADMVISAADGRATIFNMLDGKYVDEKITDLYNNGRPFPSLLFIGLGVKKEIPEYFGLTSGLTFALKNSFVAGGEVVDKLEVMIYNFDPSMAPAGKTALTVMFPTSYTYWKELSADREKYDTEKKDVAMNVIRGLSSRFPGLEADVEMADVATPLTFERYTGNYQGNFEGWLPTPQAMMKPISKTLPGLDNFYMVGQWVQAGGGLPSGVMTAREVMKRICKQAGRGFKTAKNLR